MTFCVEISRPSGVKIESVCPFAPVTIIFPVPPYIWGVIRSGFLRVGGNEAKSVYL